MRRMKRIGLGTVMLLMAFCLWLACLPARAESPEAVIQAVLAEQRAGGTLQAWVDGALTETADSLGGWYLIALRHLGLPADYTRPRRALEEKLAAAETAGITKRERMALTLLALGSRNPAIDAVADRGAEEETLMPLVFGLHLMNNGAGQPENRRKTAEKILNLQLADGGWAVIGTDCDVDCTAMTLQALAPLREESDAVAEAVDRGVTALTGIQQENGGFLGMGMESAESCAQVLLALSDLGLDGAKEEAFVRPGGSVMDAMMRFRLEGEGFAHDLKTGKMNETATVQCFYALVGYQEALNGRGPYYVFDFPETAATPAGFFPGGMTARGWAWLGIGLALLASWILAWRRGKRNWRSYAFPLLVALAAAAAVSVLEIQSPEGYYAGNDEKDSGDRNVETTISIRCDTAAGEHADVPADGILLAEETLYVAEGDTAFDQLLEATRAHRIQMEYDGTTAGAYVRGIGYLYEYQFGNLSGWMYRVNGVFADVGCSQYRLRPGDRVEWIYTRNLGKDQEP